MATHAHGTTLAGTSLGTIGEILDLNIGGPEVDEIETSSMDTTNKIKTFISGMIDPGEITFNCIYIKADLDSLLDAVGDTDTFTVTYADTSTRATSGFLKAVSEGHPFEEKITVDVTIRCSGEWTFTPAV